MQIIKVAATTTATALEQKIHVAHQNYEKIQPEIHSRTVLNDSDRKCKLFRCTRVNKLCLFFFLSLQTFFICVLVRPFVRSFVRSTDSILRLYSCIIFSPFIEFFFSAFILMCWQYARLKKTKIRLKLWYEFGCVPRDANETHCQ